MFIIDMLFPGRCPICDGLLEPEDNIQLHHTAAHATLRRIAASSTGIHAECQKKLYIVSSPTCMKCGQPIDDPQGEYCFDCGRKRHAFIQGKGVFLYKGAIKTSMYRFKYGGKPEYARYFAMQANKYYGKWIQQEKIDLIIPVPMYRKKEKMRGYNQAATFAKALSKETGIPYSKKMVKRTKNTEPQKLLNDVERKNNLKNAFKVEENIVKYRQILIVDDIYTTGSTIDAIASEIKKTGTQNIYFLSICIGKGI